MGIKVTILGSNSATPAHHRHHSAQLVNVEGRYYLVDCGEGTQLQMKRYKIKAQRIDHIFISHLHGDHYLGLVGLLSSMHLMGRKKELHLYAPYGLSEIIRVQLKYSETAFNYEVIFHEVDTESHRVIHEDEQITVKSIPLSHRIPCSGFLIEEKVKNRRIIKELLPEGLPVNKIIQLKKGQDITNESGEVLYTYQELTKPPRKSYSYAYCSDTRYDESIVPLIKGCDMLYHEATFLEEHLDRASTTFHSTAMEAARIAVKAEVGKLLLGHFSVRYKDILPLQEEARTIFKNSHAAIEGKSYILDD